MRVNPHIFYRYESQIDGGTTYIFNSNSYEILKTTELAYLIIKGIDEQKNINTILKSLDNQVSIEELKTFTQELIDLKIISDY